MMRKVIITLALGFGILYAYSALAKEGRIRYSGFVFPSNCGCFYSGFFGVGTHLGLGPGYPGLQPPLSIFNHYGFYPGRYRLPLRKSPVMVYTIKPLSRIHSGQRHTPSVTMPKDNSQDKPNPIQAAVGRDFRRTAPALADEANNKAQFNNYIPRRCYRGECYEISPDEALSSDAPPGIIIWEPKY